MQCKPSPSACLAVAIFRPKGILMFNLPLRKMDWFNTVNKKPELPQIIPLCSLVSWGRQVHCCHFLSEFLPLALSFSSFLEGNSSVSYPNNFFMQEKGQNYIAPWLRPSSHHFPYNLWNIRPTEERCWNPLISLGLLRPMVSTAVMISSKIFSIGLSWKRWS